MPVSESQNRANMNYRQRNEKRVGLSFYPPDYDLFEWLEEQPSKAGYIKQLIREDMEKKKGLIN